MLLICLAAVVAGSAADFSVFVPNGSVSEPRGSSAVLPCGLTPILNAETFEIRWYRHDYNHPVLLYKDQKVQENVGDPQYRGRASLIGHLQEGNVSLKLEDLVVGDSGEYVCHVKSTTWYEKAGVNLTVIALGSSPLVSLTEVGDQVNVTCASDGWSLKPTVTWRDKEARELPHSRTRYKTDSEGLVSVSSWLLVSPSESDWISCSVGLSDQEMKEARVQPNKGIWREAFISTLVLSLIVIVTLTVLLLLVRQDLLPHCSSHKNAKAAVDSRESIPAESHPLTGNSTEKTVVEDSGISAQSLEPPVSAEKPLKMWKKLKDQKEKLTLDPASRPSSLTIQQGGVGVYCGQHSISTLLNPDPFPQILSREVFSSGRKYWEVLVDQKERCKKSWCVGVTQKPPTKETLRALCYDEQSGIYTSTEPHTRIPVEDHFTTLGLLLDFPQNTLSFYNVDKRAHLHTFSIRDMSKQKYCAVISPGVKDQNTVKFL